MLCVRIQYLLKVGCYLSVAHELTYKSLCEKMMRFYEQFGSWCVFGHVYAPNADPFVT